MLPKRNQIADQAGTARNDTLHNDSDSTHTFDTPEGAEQTRAYQDGIGILSNSLPQSFKLFTRTCIQN